MTLQDRASVGVPWLGHACGMPLLPSGRENLCDAPEFTGYTRDGGYATHGRRRGFCFRWRTLDRSPAPLLCAGLIGWRALVAGTGRAIGLYGFGAAAHIIAQVCRWQGRGSSPSPGPATRGPGVRPLARRRMGRRLRREPPAPLDAAIIFAPVGALVPAALARCARAAASSAAAST